MGKVFVLELTADTVRDALTEKGLDLPKGKLSISSDGEVVRLEIVPDDAPAP